MAPGAAIQCLDPDAPVSNQPGPGVTGGPVAPARPFPPPGLPSRAEAERVARDLAARAGLDLKGADVRVTDGLAARTVTIAAAVGGLPTSGFAWSVGVGAKGVVRHASGHLAVAEPADTYPLIGVPEGFERLKTTAPFAGALRPGTVTPGIALDPCPRGVGTPCNSKPPRPRVATVTGPASASSSPRRWPRAAGPAWPTCCPPACSTWRAAGPTSRQSSSPSPSGG